MIDNLLKDFRKTIDNKKAILSSKVKSLNSLEKDLKELKIKEKFANEALLILQTVAQQTQQELEYRISELVTLALSSVFDDPYKMELIYETKRNKTEALILFERRGERCHPLSSTGGGAVDVAAFALRISLWSLSNKRTDNVIILDEPFRFLSRDKLKRAGEMLKEISRKLDLQIIMVSHLDELIDGADKVFAVRQIKGVSKVWEAS